MELEEIQATWSILTKELEKQKKLTNEIILNMTQEKYKNKFNKISNYETVGAIICYAIVLLVLIYFKKLDTWYLQLCGVLTAGFLIVLPTLVLRSLKNIKNLNIIGGSYKDNLIAFTKEKNRLLKLQQVGIALSFLLMFIIVPVTSKIISDKNVFLTEIKPVQGLALVVALIFMAIVASWGYRSYKKVTQSAENLLRDLES